MKRKQRIRVFFLALGVAVGCSFDLFGLSSFRFQFREANIRDASYRHFVGEWWNPIFDLSYGQVFFSEILAVHLGCGVMTTSGNRLGVQTGRLSEESISVLLIRPQLLVTLQYSQFAVRPFVEAGLGVFYFSIEEGGTFPRSVEGWKSGPLGRVGVNFSCRKFFFPHRPFPTAEELDVEDVILSIAGGFEWLNLLTPDGMNFSNYYGTLGLEMLY